MNVPFQSPDAATIHAQNDGHEAYMIDETEHLHLGGTRRATLTLLSPCTPMLLLNVNA